MLLGSKPEVNSRRTAATDASTVLAICAFAALAPKAAPAVAITPCIPEVAVLIAEPMNEPTALEPAHASNKKKADQIVTPIIAPNPGLLIRLSLTARKQAM